MTRGQLRCLLPWCAAVAVLVIAGPRPADLPADASAGGWASWAAGDPEHALVTVVGVAAWLVLSWLALGALTVLGGRGAGALGALSRRLSAVLLPRLIREGLAVALGLSVVVGSAGAAAASPAPGRAALVATTATAVPSLDRLAPGTLQLAPLPAVPPPVLAPQVTATPGAATPPQRRPAASGETPDEVVVLRGDCLWSVVARHLGPAATDARIARAWPEWYAANRAVIGPDPSLLLPGQRLTPPPLP